MTISVRHQSRKRLFIGLLTASLLFLAAMIVLAYYILSRPDLLISKFFLVLTIFLVSIIFFLLVLGIGALTWSLWYSKSLPSLHLVMFGAANWLFPFALALGKWFGMEEERIKNSYIQVSNQLVRTRMKGKPVKRVLVLAPHCLQWARCPHKITINVDNCQRCGKCPVSTLLELAERYQVLLKVVTGGTSARKTLKDHRPEAVVAIACERDLTSGLQDTAGFPVLGVVNERPEGPCYNTRVPMHKVEEAIQFLLKGG